MFRLPIAFAAFALLAAPAADAKTISWLLMSEQPSGVPGQAITLRTAVTSRNYVAPPRPLGAELGAYLVRGEYSGHLFVRTAPPVRLGTLQTDLSYRGRGALRIPRLEPGVYHLAARFGDSFDVGRDVLVVRRADDRGLLASRAEVVVGLSCVAAAIAAALVIRLRS